MSIFWGVDVQSLVTLSPPVQPHQNLSIRSISRAPGCNRHTWNDPGGDCCWVGGSSNMSASKNRGKTSKMDGENSGNPYENG